LLVLFCQLNAPPRKGASCSRQNKFEPFSEFNGKFEKNVRDSASKPETRFFDFRKPRIGHLFVVIMQTARTIVGTVELRALLRNFLAPGEDVRELTFIDDDSGSASAEEESPPKSGHVTLSVSFRETSGTCGVYRSLEFVVPVPQRDDNPLYDARFFPRDARVKIMVTRYGEDYLIISPTHLPDLRSAAFFVAIGEDVTPSADCFTLSVRFSD